MKLKIRIAAVALMGMSLGVKAQEKITTENGAKSDFIYKEGKVGIGTISPVEKLDLRGDLHINSGVNDNHIFWSGHNMTMGTRLGNYAHNVFNLKPGGADQGMLFSVFKMHIARSKTNHEVKVQFHSNSSSFINGGRLGIGTKKPDKLLTLKSNSYLGWEYTGEGSGSHHTITGGGINPMSFTVNPFSANTPIFKFNGHKGTNVTILNGGNVGIGTINPSEKLEINGNTKFSNLYLSSGNVEEKGNKIFQKFTDNNGSAEANIEFYRNKSSRGGGVRSSSEIRFSTTSSSYSADNLGLSTKMIVKGNGNVGIGETNPDSKLSVNGKIHTKEVKVDLVGWSDFVFYENYKLPTLTEVETHIKENGHLKDIPSAKQVAKNGILLGEMDSKLLQKIEELTLYTIQQEKSLHSQKEEINNLKKENEILKSLNFKLLEIQKRLDKLEGAK